MLAQLATAHSSIVDNGGAVIRVAPAASSQAIHLMGTSIPYELLMESDDRLSRRLEIGVQSVVRFVFNLKAWWNYTMAFARDRRQGNITRSYAALPAIIVANEQAKVTYRHPGTGIADYPPLTQVLGDLAELLQASPRHCGTESNGIRPIWLRTRQGMTLAVTGRCVWFGLESDTPHTEKNHSD
jgi:hypothetical protein